MRPEIRGNGGAGLGAVVLVFAVIGLIVLAVRIWLEKLSDWWRGRRRK